jgi:uncharacterized membrane protein
MTESSSSWSAVPVPIFRMRSLRVWDWDRSIPPGLVALALAAVYFVVSYALSIDRLHALLTQNWDLGVYQQALWTGSHGGSFYEAGDFESFGVPSLLLVHPSFLLLAIAPAYATFPSPATLFALQSGAIAATALPLFLLARRVLGRPWFALAPVAVYLVYAPLLAGNLYDFHVEAFLPLEIVALFYLWHSRRFAAGFAVAAVAFVTIEIAPLLVLFLGLAFLVPSAAGVARIRERLRGLRSVRLRIAAVVNAVGDAFRRRPVVRASVALVGASILAYGLLRYLEWTVLPARLGGTPVAPADGVWGYLVPTCGYACGLGAGQPATAASPRASVLAERWRDWFLLYALVAFVPLFAPRTQILQVPWFVFTLLESRLTFTQIGYQYDLIAAAPIAIGFVFGLAFWLNPRPLRRSHPSRRIRPSDGGAEWAGSRRRRLASGAVVAAVVGLVVIVAAANLAVGPVGPDSAALGQVGPGESVVWPAPPGYGDLERLVELIPSGGTVAATNDLFDLVANDRNAYAFLPTGHPQDALPDFSATHRPSFVLMSTEREFPPWLLSCLSDPEDYVPWGVAWTTPHGPVFLFGPPASAPPPLDLGVGFSWPLGFNATRLGVGPSGERVADPAAPGDAVIRSTPGVAGFAWYSPRFSLPAGRYVATLRLAVMPTRTASAPPLSWPVLRVVFTAAVGDVLGDFGSFPGVVGRVANATFAESGAGRWASLALPFVAPRPVLNLEIWGWSVLNSGTFAEVGMLTIEPASSVGAAPN